jgi:hypothetical protein
MLILCCHLQHCDLEHDGWFWVRGATDQAHQDDSTAPCHLQVYEFLKRISLKDDLATDIKRSVA